MRQYSKILKRYAVWLYLLLMVNIFYVIIMWIMNAKELQAVAVTVILASLLFFCVICGVVCVHERKREDAFRTFLDCPDQYHEEKLLAMCSTAEGEQIQLLGNMFRKKQEKYDELASRLTDYEEYVEIWAHETKTPISLLTLLLDNHRATLSGDITQKLDFVRNKMQESITQILFYSRLKSKKKDYLFQNISLNECIEEVLEEYGPLLEEGACQISVQIPDMNFYSDRRSVTFILNQLIGNAIKYHLPGKPAGITLHASNDEEESHLWIRDEGIGVRPCDLPHIFDKGFTGDSEDGRKKATGMGLYLSKELAKDLNISLDAKSEWQKGFEMMLTWKK